MRGTNGGTKSLSKRGNILFFSELSICRLETRAPQLCPATPPAKKGFQKCLPVAWMQENGTDISGLSDAYRVDSDQFACVVFPGLRWQFLLMNHAATAVRCI